MPRDAPLASLFAAELAEPGELAALEARLRTLDETARRAWPGVALPTERFVAHLARHAAGSPRFLDEVHGADLFLAAALLAGDAAALAHFDREFIARVGEYVVRVTVARDEVDEIRQVLRARLLVGDGGPARIAEYSGAGALGGWVRISAVRAALNLKRGQRAGAEPAADEPDPGMDAELALVRARAQGAFRTAFTEVLAQLTADERTILRLHHVDGLTMDQLARMFRTPRSTIARRIDQVRKQILTATEAELAAAHRLSPSAVASVIRGARSQFHVTLSRLLK